jgi:hypothetical protein
MVKYLGRFESLDKSKDVLCSAGIKLDFSKHVNRTTHESYKKYYTSEMKSKIYNLYGLDFEMFGYEKEFD